MKLLQLLIFIICLNFRLSKKTVGILQTSRDLSTELFTENGDNGVEFDLAVKGTAGVGFEA